MNQLQWPEAFTQAILNQDCNLARIVRIKRAGEGKRTISDLARDTLNLTQGMVTDDEIERIERWIFTHRDWQHQGQVTLELRLTNALEAGKTTYLTQGTVILKPQASLSPLHRRNLSPEGHRSTRSFTHSSCSFQREARELPPMDEPVCIEAIKLEISSLVETNHKVTARLERLGKALERFGLPSLHNPQHLTRSAPTQI